MIWSDLRYGARNLRLNKSFSLTAILALAAGIAATTAIFSVVDTVLLRPLPYPQPDRLVAVSAWLEFDSVVSAEYLAWAGTNRVFASYAATAANYDRAPLATGGDPVLVTVKRVTANFLDTLGVQPLVGRGFRPEDINPGGRFPMLISYGLWQRYFNGDRNVVGRSAVFDGVPREITGVLPRNFYFPTGVPVDALVPIKVDIGKVRARLTMGMWHTIGRLKPGVSLQQARANMRALFAVSAAAYPRMYRHDVRVRVIPLQEWLTGNVRLSLLVLVAGVCSVLLIACANVANLLLARAAGRRQEIAIRAALGASRWRLIRQLLTESALLAAAGGAGGVALAMVAVAWLRRGGPQDLPRLAELAVDARVMAFAVAISAATGVVFGLAPAFSASRPPSRFARSGPRGFLIAAELALSVTLLIAAGLMFQSLRRLQHKHVGFVPERLITATLPPRTERAALAARVMAIPAVESTAFSDSLPPTGGSSYITFSREGRPLPEPGHRGDSMIVRHVGPAYFSTLRIPLLRGRLFSSHDEPGAVAVVNQALARAYFPGEDPIGKRIDLLPRGASGRIVVGIVGDVKNEGLNREPDPEMYRPLGGSERAIHLIVRTLGDPSRATAALRQELRAADPQAVATVRTFEQQFDQMTAGPRFQGAMFGSFAAVALLLAGIGIYGVVSFTVARRRREIGIRLALGADGPRVGRMVLSELLIPTVSGIAAGLAGSLAAGRVLRSLLYDVKPGDPLTYAGVSLFLALVALAAGAGLARRAARVDPAEVLRAE